MENIFDVAIIGSGPSGLTAAIYTSRANLKTIVLGGVKWGGQLMLTTTVENFPGFPDGIAGPELMEKMRSQAEKFDTKMIYEDVISVNPSSHPELVSGSLANASPDSGEMLKRVQHDTLVIKTTSSEYLTKSIILATGADTQWLGLPNELRLIGHGVSSCAPCDAFFFKNKKVAVIGGGDAAMEEALVLSKFASDVTIIHRRDVFRASKIMQDRVLADPKIKILFNTEVVDVVGQDKVEGLKFKNGDNFACDGVFVAIGHSPNTKAFENIIELDEKGYALKAKLPGTFIAGDVADHTYKQAITAAAFGAMAALDVEKWLEDQRLHK